MNGKWWSIAVLVAIAGMLLGVNSCGRSQQLVSIQIQPTVETFGSSTTPVIDNAGGQVQLRALRVERTLTCHRFQTSFRSGTSAIQDVRDGAWSRRWSA